MLEAPIAGSGRGLAEECTMKRFFGVLGSAKMFYDGAVDAAKRDDQLYKVILQEEINTSQRWSLGLGGGGAPVAIGRTPLPFLWYSTTLIEQQSC